MTGDDQAASLRDSAALELNRLVGPPVEVTDELLSSCRTDNQFGPLAFELYKEAATLIRFICMHHLATEPYVPQLNRNQAICVGLLVRISKLIISVIKLSADTEHGETVKILNRCIVESAVNLRYLLLKKGEPRIFDRFVESSLRPEVELYDFIKANVKKNNGRKLAIEDRMIKSILDTFDNSGLDLESARHKRGSWAGSFRDRLAALNMEEAYAAFQMVPSHAVHGDWVEILKEHLLPSGNEFEACTEWRKTDGEMLGTVANFAIEAGLNYLTEYFEGPLTEALEERLDDVMHRITRTELSREDWQEIDKITSCEHPAADSAVAVRSPGPALPRVRISTLVVRPAPSVRCIPTRPVRELCLVAQAARSLGLWMVGDTSNSSNHPAAATLSTRPAPNRSYEAFATYRPNPTSMHGRMLEDWEILYDSRAITRKRRKLPRDSQFPTPAIDLTGRPTRKPTGW